MSRLLPACSVDRRNSAAAWSPARQEAEATERRVALAAVQSLYDELAAYPKPGLVSLVDSGSHRDMDAGHFFRSLFSLRAYFRRIFRAGRDGTGFTGMNRLGQAAEARMLAATGGVNTHRGAIFNLGLLAAAAGRLLAQDSPLAGRALGHTVREQWGAAIARQGAAQSRDSHGGRVLRRYRAGGAREEAIGGFPHVFATGLPALTASLKQGSSPAEATLQCLFSLLAELADTNLLYRGGEEGLAFARAAAREFLAAGGVHRPGWRTRALAVHRQFVARNLSPGGSADLVAACLFVHRLQLLFPPDEA